MTELEKVTRELAVVGKEVAAAYEGFGTTLLWCLVIGAVIGIAIAIAKKRRG